MLRHLARTVCLGLALLGSPAWAQEVIRTYDVTVQVEASGELLVTERIAVKAEGITVKHGIYREFPTIHRYPSGLARTTTFDVEQVTRDGKPEAFQRQGMQDGVRLIIGNATMLVPPGEHVYEITYRTARQLGHFNEFDELNWNVTGNAWSLGIEHVGATVLLPDGAAILQQASYTGPSGATGQDARVIRQEGHLIAFESTRSLAPGEGLTIAVGFPRGIVPPSNGTIRLLIDNLGLFILFAGTPLIGLFYFRFWRRFGGNPKAGLVIPRFVAPGNLSPSDVCYAHYRGKPAVIGATPRSFIAALIGFAAEKRIRLEKAGDAFKAIRLGEPTNGISSTLDVSLLNALFDGAKELVFDGPAQSRTIGAFKRFELRQGERIGARWFKRYTGRQAKTGLALSGALLLAAIMLSPMRIDDLLRLAAAVGGTAAVAPWLVAGLRRLTGDQPHGSLIWAWLKVLGGGAVCLLLASGWLFSDHLPLDPGGTAVAWASVAMLGCGVLLALSFFVFRFLFDALTPEGRKIADEIAGLKLFLTVADGDRLAMAGAPDFSIELYERLLPYAIAIGVERRWSQAMANYLSKASTAVREAFAASYSSFGIDPIDVDCGLRLALRVAWTSAAVLAAQAAAEARGRLPQSEPWSSPAPGSTGAGSSGSGGGGGGGGGW